MEKRWAIKDKTDQETIDLLQKELGVDAVLANLLAQRGMDTFEKVCRYFVTTDPAKRNPFAEHGNISMHWHKCCHNSMHY